MPFVFSRRSLNNLKGVHPLLVDIAHEALKRVPYDFIVTEGLRTRARQAELLAQGKSRTMNSYHLPQADGYGHAIDIAVIPPAGGVTWEFGYYKANADVFLKIAAAKGVQLTWGGSWKNFIDSPHFQLEPKNLPV